MYNKKMAMYKYIRSVYCTMYTQLNTNVQSKEGNVQIYIKCILHNRRQNNYSVRRH